jgi:HPt (histidine-containing phosphotransfer) domain-containing protein
MTARFNPTKTANDSLQPGVVRVEKELEQLVKRFLERQEGSLQRMQKALGSGDLVTIRRLGHDLKGAGEVFGFPELSILGARFEQAAQAGDVGMLATHIASMKRYLKRLQLKFV